jgi:hypothetical protein
MFNRGVIIARQPETKDSLAPRVFLAAGFRISLGQS